MSRFSEPAWQRHLHRTSWVLVTLVGLWLLWPVPLGRAPLSADHTVHLTRIWLWAQQLAQGHVRGWSDVWFAGAPVGELYPVLGDAIVIAVRGLSLGMLEWPQAYALGFTLVFVSQGWAMLRLGRTCGLGPLPGTLAGLWCLVDVGAYREGGWLYTVVYGVWPQALATTLTWLALAELARLVESSQPLERALSLVRGALCVAGALVAHPVSLPVLALAAPILWVVLGRGSRAGFRRAGLSVTLMVALGGALAAWWLLPMMRMGPWMASYGWLWQPLKAMLDVALAGRITQNMPGALAGLVALGLVAVAFAGSNAARAWAALGVVLWLWTSADTLWDLRLDLVHSGFSRMQWQRFVIAAKPGLYCAAGCGVAIGLRTAARLAAWRPWGVAPAVLLGAAVVGALGWAGYGQWKVMQRYQVGEVQIHRDAHTPAFDGEYEQLIAAVDELVRADPENVWRVSVAAPRNSHWYMDLPVFTGARLYKQGFTPGDNFVHKPESGSEAVLDALHARYMITRGPAMVRDAQVIREIGSLRIWERRGWMPALPVRLIGEGTLELAASGDAGDGLEFSLHGTSSDAQVVTSTAGYPRWELTHDGVAVPWFEVPLVGDGPEATLGQRRRGELVGGKAGGDDGSEPILIAAAAQDGRWRLSYRRWTSLDVLAAMISLVALGGCLALVAPGRPQAAQWLGRVWDRAAKIFSPWLLLVALVALVAFGWVRVHRGQAEERGRAVGWLMGGQARVQHMQAGPLKADMLVRPALIVPAIAGATAVAEFRGVHLGDRLTGFYALDDDGASMRREGRHRFTVEARRAKDDGAWVSLFDKVLPHRPGRHALDVEPGALAHGAVDIRVTVSREGNRPPGMGFDLDLGEVAP